MKRMDFQLIVVGMVLGIIGFLAGSAAAGPLQVSSGSAGTTSLTFFDSAILLIGDDFEIEGVNLGGGVGVIFDPTVTTSGAGTNNEAGLFHIFEGAAFGGVDTSPCLSPPSISMVECGVSLQFALRDLAFTGPASVLDGPRHLDGLFTMTGVALIRDTQTGQLFNFDLVGAGTLSETFDCLGRADHLCNTPFVTVEYIFDEPPTFALVLIGAVVALTLPVLRRRAHLRLPQRPRGLA